MFQKGWTPMRSGPHPWKRVTRVLAAALMATLAAFPAAATPRAARYFAPERPAVPADFAPSGLAALSLAQLDWDGDGFPDLVAGFAAPHGGRLFLFRGNVDSVFPNAPEAKARRGKVPELPFFGPERSLDVPARPDFMVAGDFDLDGLPGLVVAAAGGEELVWLR